MATEKPTRYVVLERSRLHSWQSSVERPSQKDRRTRNKRAGPLSQSGAPIGAIEPREEGRHVLPAFRARSMALSEGCSEAESCEMEVARRLPVGHFHALLTFFAERPNFAATETARLRW